MWVFSLPWSGILDLSAWSSWFLLCLRNIQLHALNLTTDMITHVSEFSGQSALFLNATWGNGVSDNTQVSPLPWPAILAACRPRARRAHSCRHPSVCTTLSHHLLLLASNTPFCFQLILATYYVLISFNGPMEIFLGNPPSFLGNGTLIAF